MKLSSDQITQIATLARLELSVAEKTMYAKQLSAVLEYVEMLDEVNTEGVEETCQVTGLKNVMRWDDVKTCDEDMRKKLIENFPDKVGDLLKVKAVFE
jgi:aspartyl-tRNA(Asn)/glutamyl-tRNA(Gln) amidotransferase subunit C